MLFFKINLYYGIMLSYREVTKTVVFPYTLHPVSSDVNSLQQPGTFVKTKKLMLYITIN